MAFLAQVDERGGIVERWELGQVSVIAGRGAECEIKLTDRRASRRHFGISFQDGAHFVADLGSANGTLLNGLPLKTRVRLMPGDKICVGDSVLVYELQKPKGLSTIIAELEQEASAGKGYRTMLREILRDAKQ